MASRRYHTFILRVAERKVMEGAVALRCGTLLSSRMGLVALRLKYQPATPPEGILGAP